jgi:glycerol-3-phosphate dehydrogenase subunit C
MTDSRKNISYLPTDGLSYNPAEPKYWDEGALAKETERVFEVCHGCRLCFKFCDSFPELFKLIDTRYDGDVRKITAGDTERIFDACFQCKLCDVNCPYTPREGHEYLLDFPRLAHRHRAVRARSRGIPLRDRLLADPDASGRLARASLGTANIANRLGLPRWFMEKFLGIHRGKLLPEFTGETFEAWAEKSGRIAREPGGEVVLFQTCYVQNNEPQIGIDTVDVLERNQVKVSCARGLCCCGMPSWEKGDLDSLRRQAKRNLAVLAPFVARGARVLAINPTCSMMFRREYPELVAPEERQTARKVAEATMDPSEFLWSIRNEARFNTAFKSTPGGTISCHAPCHLRAQAIGFRSRDLLKKIPGVKPVLVQECCGHNGTYAMTVEGFEPSKRIGSKAFEAMKEAQAALWATDCPLAALQFQQHAGMRPMHPMSILARAYRADGFETKVEDADQQQDGRDRQLQE